MSFEVLCQSAPSMYRFHFCRSQCESRLHEPTRRVAIHRASRRKNNVRVVIREFQPRLQSCSANSNWLVESHTHPCTVSKIDLEHKRYTEGAHTNYQAHRSAESHFCIRKPDQEWVFDHDTCSRQLRQLTTVRSSSSTRMSFAAGATELCSCSLDHFTAVPAPGCSTSIDGLHAELEPSASMDIWIGFPNVVLVVIRRMFCGWSRFAFVV